MTQSVVMEEFTVFPKKGEAIINEDKPAEQGMDWNTDLETRLMSMDVAYSTLSPPTSSSSNPL